MQISSSWSCRDPDNIPCFDIILARILEYSTRLWCRSWCARSDLDLLRRLPLGLQRARLAFCPAPGGVFVLPATCPLTGISMGPGPWFNIKMSSYQYRKSHCGDKTVVRSSYLHNGISYTGQYEQFSCLRFYGFEIPQTIFLKSIQEHCSYLSLFNYRTIWSAHGEKNLTMELHNSIKKPHKLTLLNYGDSYIELWISIIFIKLYQ